MKKVWFMAGLVLVAWAAQAACPSWPTTDRFIFNIAGDEVTDLRTGLIWRRCNEGLTWNGTTCTGTLLAPNHQGALALAQTANPSGSPKGWRLPNVKELSSLVDVGCTVYDQIPVAVIDLAAFPATNPTWHWTSTPWAPNPQAVYLVQFANGYAQTGYRHDKDGHIVGAAVRLVRSGP